jgi:PTH1 family peptidyl-tRNA hydrolase
MKIIVGLGNPGREYAQTKHNAGFLFVDALAGRLGADAWRDKFEAQVAETHIGPQKVLLVKPQTYMNDSGRAVGPLMRFYKLPVEDLIVVHDDMDIPCGTIRLRKKGSAGGHNGIKSILAALGDEHFVRVRIGIGRPAPGWTVVNHVLAPFSTENAPKIAAAIDGLIPAVECIVTDGIDLAMNRYNPRKQKKSRAAAPEEKEGEQA